MTDRDIMRLAALEAWLACEPGADLIEAVAASIKRARKSAINQTKPRCETCAHWTREPDVRATTVDGNEWVIPERYERATTGVCGANVIWSDCGDYTIFTDEQFGCVEWKTEEKKSE